MSVARIKRMKERMDAQKAFENKEIESARKFRGGKRPEFPSKKGKRK